MLDLFARQPEGGCTIRYLSFWFRVRSVCYLYEVLCYLWDQLVWWTLGVVHRCILIARLIVVYASPTRCYPVVFSWNTCCVRDYSSELIIWLLLQYLRRDLWRLCQHGMIFEICCGSWQSIVLFLMKHVGTNVNTWLFLWDAWCYLLRNLVSSYETRGDNVNTGLFL